MNSPGMNGALSIFLNSVPLGAHAMRIFVLKNMVRLA